MHRMVLVCAAVVIMVAPAVADAQFFFEDFDSYTPGSGIIGQGGWEGWAGNPGADAIVSALQSYTPPNSLQVALGADVVHQFAGVTNGVWYAKAWTYVPSGQVGEMWFILLNTYDGACANAGDCNWSVQVVLCQSGCTQTGVNPGLVTNFGGSDVSGVGTAPLILNQWVEVVAEVNLDANSYTVYYDGVPFDTQTWTVTGQQAIQAIDLYSSGSSDSYMDNIWLDTTIPVELQSFDVE